MVTAWNVLRPVVDWLTEEVAEETASASLNPDAAPMKLMMKKLCHHQAKGCFLLNIDRISIDRGRIN